MNAIKKLWQKIKPKAKKVLGVLAVAAAVSQGLLGIGNLAASSARFNYLPGDQELLRGANSTKGETVWKDPVTGEVGDVFSGLVYYHNGIEGVIAENTKIKVTIPAETTNKTAVLSARISADNAEAVTDTIVEGSGVTGNSGLTVNLDADANLALIPGTVKWYPNRMDSPDGSASILPLGQSGDEIVSANGINLGDINGCWPYAGYVLFQFRATPKEIPQNPELDIAKSVRNITTGEAAYAEETNAAKNDIVEFKIRIKNDGDASLTSAILHDQLPAELGYQSGTMKLSKNGESAYASLSDLDAHKVFDEGLNIGNIAAGTSDYLVFSTKTPVSIASAKTVINTASATSGSLSDSDTAKVNLIPDEYTIIVPNKTAKNLTSGQIAVPRMVAGRTVLAADALAGQTIEYTLITKNTGNKTAESYVIQDGIADILEYADVTSVSNGGSVVDGTSGNDAKLVKYPAVNIAGGESVVRTFTVKVLDPTPATPANGFHFDMQMYNKYGDEVIVFLSIPTPPQKYPSLHIEKLVRNFSINEVNFVDQNSAISGDTLEYKILFSNTGEAAADQVRFSDILPANTSYIAGTTLMSVNGGAEQVMPDGIAGAGITVDSIAAGTSGYIKFRVVTSTGISNGTILVNTATLTDNGASIYDIASTVIKIPVVVKTSLPKTGADTVVVAIVALLLAGTSTILLRRFI